MGMQSTLTETLWFMLTGLIFAVWDQSDEVLELFAMESWVFSSLHEKWCSHLLPT